MVMMHSDRERPKARYVIGRPAPLGTRCRRSTTRSASARPT